MRLSNTFKLFFCFNVLLATSACSQTYTTKIGGNIFNKFPHEQKVSSSKYLRINNFNTDGLLIYNDSLLIIRTKAGDLSHHFATFSLKDSIFLDPLMPVGRQAGEVLAFLSYGLLGDSLWAFDAIKEDLIFVPISTMDSNRATVIEKPFNSFYYDIQPLNRQRVLVSGDYDSDYKLQFANLEDRSLEGVISYFTDEDYSPSRTDKMDYESFLFLKPSQDKCVFARRYADQIEIIDLSKKESIIINGPENFAPNLSRRMENYGEEISMRNAKTKYGFVKGKVTDNFIYLLFSGNNHQSSHMHFGKEIFVYDWNGNPVKKITLDDYIVDFAITSNEETIYMFCPKTKSIEVAQLK